MGGSGPDDPDDAAGPPGRGAGAAAAGPAAGRRRPHRCRRGRGRADHRRGGRGQRDDRRARRRPAGHRGARPAGDRRHRRAGRRGRGPRAAARHRRRAARPTAGVERGHGDVRRHPRAAAHHRRRDLAAGTRPGGHRRRFRAAGPRRRHPVAVRVRGHADGRLDHRLAGPPQPAGLRGGRRGGARHGAARRWGRRCSRPRCRSRPRPARGGWVVRLVAGSATVRPERGRTVARLLAPQGFRAIWSWPARRRRCAPTTRRAPGRQRAGGHGHRPGPDRRRARAAVVAHRPHRGEVLPRVDVTLEAAVERRAALALAAAAADVRTPRLFVALAAEPDATSSPTGTSTPPGSGTSAATASANRRWRTPGHSCCGCAGPASRTGWSAPTRSGSTGRAAAGSTTRPPARWRPRRSPASSTSPRRWWL